MIGDDSTTSAVPSSPTSTGNVPSLRQPGDGVAGVVGRVEQRHERAVVDGQQGVHRDQRMPAPASSRSAPGSAQSDVFSTVDRQLEQAPACRRPTGRSTRTTPSTRSRCRTRRPTTAPVRRAQHLDLVAGGQARTPRHGSHRRGAAAGSGRGRSRARPPRPTATHVDAVDVDGPSTGTNAVAAVEAASTARCCTCRQRTRTCSTAAGPGIDDDLGAHASTARSRRAAAQRRRREHAELPAQLVLPRRRPVRVQHVALVEHGVGHRAGRREAIAACRVRHHAVLTGFLQQALDRRRPTSGSARAALNRWRASSVSG